MKIYNYKKTYNSKGYPKVTGKIKITQETTLTNPRNNGCSPFDVKWDNNAYLTIPTGTLVDYKMNEDQMGKFHNISVLKDGVKYSSTKRV